MVLLMTSNCFSRKSCEDYEVTCSKLMQIIGYLKIWLDGDAQVKGASQRTPHVRSTLNYIRMGIRGYDNDDTQDKEVDQACRDYRKAIATIVNAIDGIGVEGKLEPPPGQDRLWDNSAGTAISNDERIGIDVPWV